MKTKLPRLTPTKYVSLAVMAVLFVFLAVLPLWYEGYKLTLLSEIMKFVILTVAWVMFSAPSGYMSLATAAFYGLGFYVAAVFSGQIPFLVIIITAGVVGFVVALLVGALTLRLRGVYFCIFTFGLVLLVDQVVREVERVVSGTRGRMVHTQPAEVVYWAILGVCILTLVVAWLVKRSRHGLALASVGQHEEAAAHSGINVVRTKVFVFALSAVFMAMAGAVIGTRTGYVDPGMAFSLNQSFLPVLMALFGGMYTLVGPVVGAVVFTFLRERLLTTFPELFMIIFGLVMIIAVLFLPNGIVGLVQQMWRVARRKAPPLWRRLRGMGGGGDAPA
jgi:branched-chain amino acid transport system permease protein